MDLTSQTSFKFHVYQRFTPSECMISALNEW